MNLYIDRNINSIENKLTEISAYPLAGTLAAGAKIFMGAVQGLTALAYGILIFVPSAIKEDWSPLKYSWTHIKHGLGNMAVEVPEALPLVQTVLYWARQLRQAKASDMAVHLYTHHECKFMPYTSLVEIDWRFEGGESQEFKNIKKIFNEKIEKNGGIDQLSLKKEFELAQEAMSELSTT